MEQQVIINFSRPGKGITRYIEGMIDDNPVRLITLNRLSPDFSLKWCEEIWWQNGSIPHGVLVDSVVKFLYYKEWFSVMQLLDHDGVHLGYYVDIDTPLRKLDGEYYLTDMFLDLWIAPDGMFAELDRDEFEEGYRLGLITDYQYRKANLAIEMLKSNIANGELFRFIH